VLEDTVQLLLLLLLLLLAGLYCFVALRQRAALQATLEHQTALLLLPLLSCTAHDTASLQLLYRCTADRTACCLLLGV
jgi:hypothetical protein